MKAKFNFHQHLVSVLVLPVVIDRSPINQTGYMLGESGSSKHFIDPKVIGGVESRMLDCTTTHPPIKMKAVGRNTLLGTAQGILLVLVCDTQDACRTVQLPIVLVPRLGFFFPPQLWHLKKVSKLISLKQGPLLTLAYFQFN